MRTYRRICALILALLTGACSAGWPRAAAFGFGFPGGGAGNGGEGTPQEICSVGSPDPLDPKLIFLDPTADWKTAAMEQLPSRESCQTGSGVYFCPVTWDLEALNAAQPGRQSVTGTLEPAAGYTFADGISMSVSQPVYFTGGTAADETLLQMYVESLPSTYMAVMGVNEALSSLELCNYEAQCLTANGGGSFTCPLNWDFTAVNNALPGVYTATASAVLPAGFVPPEDAAPITAAIGVVDPDAVDLSAHHITEYGNLECDYLYVPDRTTAAVEYAVGNGDWTEDPGALNAGHLRGYYFEMGDSFLIFFLNRLEAQTDYHFRVLYENGRVSNTITIRLEEKGSTAPLVTMGGNRDGSGDDTLPDLVQPISDDEDSGSQSPAPTPASGEGTVPAPQPEPIVPTPQAEPAVPTPQAEPAVPGETAAAPVSPAAPAGLSQVIPDQTGDSPEPDTEVVTDTYTILSGLRLYKLLRSGNGESVLFEKGGVAVELPGAFLAELALGDTDLLKVTVEQPAADSFRLDITAAGQELSQLSATTVRLRWEGQKNDLECVDEKKAHVSDAAYDENTQTVACTIYAPGTYSIQPIPAADTAPTPLTASTANGADSADDSGAVRRQPSGQLPVILTAAAAVGGAAALLALRRRHG